MTERPEGDRKGAGVRGGAGKLHAIEIEWFKPFNFMVCNPLNIFYKVVFYATHTLSFKNISKIRIKIA